MSQIAGPIAASESKATFMISIGLQAGIPEHERLYKLMKEDAVNAYRQVVKSRQPTVPDDNQQGTSKPRYAYTQIDKDIIREAIVSIYDKATSETKQFYDHGVDPSGESNWVIRWLLWHTFRYRDSRNKRPSTAQTAEAAMSTSPACDAIDSSPTAAIATSPTSGSRRSLPYDPVRG